VINEFSFISFKWFKLPIYQWLNNIGMDPYVDKSNVTSNIVYYPYLDSFDFVVNGFLPLLVLMCYCVPMLFIVIIACARKNSTCAQKVKDNIAWSGIIGLVMAVSHELLLYACIYLHFKVHTSSGRN